jgi:hypothetical protein
MSSPGSAVNLDLPRPLLADRLSLAAIAAAAAAVEAMFASHPDGPAGLGAALAGVLAVWQWRIVRARPRALEIGPERARLRFGHGRCAPASLAPGVRLLGGTVVLHWRSDGRRQAAWLTPADLGHENLRALAVRLVAGGSARGT